MNQDTLETIKNVTTNLLKAMEVNAAVTVTLEDEVYKVGIDSEDTGILIGYHGETLDAVGVIINQLVYKELGQWVRLSVGVGDYLEKREEQLRIIADRAVAKVVETQKSETLPYLDARERRFIHIYLQEAEGIRTESVGEGEERRLVIFPAFPSTAQ